MKREELEVQEVCFGDSALEFYHKSDADAVMDAMEQRIKELEEANRQTQKHREEMFKLKSHIKELEAEVEMDAKKRRIMVNGYNQKCERVKELEEVISKMETTTPRWISVDDRLPKGSPMLPALTEEGDRIWWGNWHDNNLKIYGITHWLDNAFPPPPTTEESSGVEKEK